jgi:hypothetical protein
MHLLLFSPILADSIWVQQSGAIFLVALSIVAVLRGRI